jgi:hypothetical protein
VTVAVRSRTAGRLITVAKSAAEFFESIPLGDGQAHLIRAKADDLVFALCGFTFKAVVFGNQVFEDEDRKLCTKCFEQIFEDNKVAERKLLNAPKKPMAVPRSG